MTLSLRAALPGTSPMAVLASLPRCSNPYCPRPPSLWQRWWARHEGIWLQSRWYCSLDCFQLALFRRLETVAMSGRRSTAEPKRLPLGLVLLSQGEITGDQLREALEQQRTAGTGRLGEWLVGMKAVSEAQVINALATQQGCPVFPARLPLDVPAKMHWPAPLSNRYHAVPMFYSQAQAKLYVGFLEQVNHGFLYTLEQMLHCGTEPCIVSPATYGQRPPLPVFDGEGETIEIHQLQSGIEMTQTIANYAQQTHAEHCDMAGCHDSLWIRLEAAQGFHCDFLFRLPSAG